MDRSYPSKAWVVGRKEECSRQNSSIQEITCHGVEQRVVRVTETHVFMCVSLEHSKGRQEGSKESRLISLPNRSMIYKVSFEFYTF